MNQSLFGPTVFNCAMARDGNTILMDKIGTKAQKARSTFAMTPSHPALTRVLRGAHDPPLASFEASSRHRSSRRTPLKPVDGFDVIRHDATAIDRSCVAVGRPCRGNR
jgi:hypothetical protein